MMLEYLRETIVAYKHNESRMKLIHKHRQESQRRLQKGYARAARIINELGPKTKLPIFIEDRTE